MTNENLSLRELAQRRGLLVGCAVNTQGFRQAMADPDSPFARTLIREFNILTAENAMKFGPLMPQPPDYDWTIADAMFDFAERHGMKVRFHTGLWHSQLPAGVDEAAMSREQLAELARHHIMTVGRRYGSRMYCWDVVNEPIADRPAQAGPLRDTIWRRAIGDDYLATVYRWAHEAAPGVKLVLNDYGVGFGGPKADALYAVVKDLLDRGVPLHAVGFQMHLLGGETPDPEALRRDLTRFADLGLDIHITEMDVAISKMTGDLAERLQRQAQVYQTVLAAAMRVPGFTVFQTWGFTDRYSWVPHFTKTDDAALIFDADYQPKPAYHALRQALR